MIVFKTKFDKDMKHNGKKVIDWFQHGERYDILLEDGTMIYDCYREELEVKEPDD